MRNLPTVSIVIVNLNGKHLLRDCFKSIKHLDYPSDKLEVVVVDNGSTDGSVEFLRKNYKSVKIVSNLKNEGFAKPSNDGARAANGEYVAFLNNDMRVEKDWLIELVNSIEEQKAQCAASLILSWNGDMLDFAGGSVNFYGLGYQYDFHVPVSEIDMRLDKDKEILFACGGAMLVDRKLFLDAGGFDEDYFAYFEDVDFGWRFTLLGNKTVLSVKSRVRHKHNGTSSRIAKERIRKLCERNNLYTIFKNYGDDIFNRVMLPAILLNLHETYKMGEIDAENYDIRSGTGFDDTPVRINHMAALKLTALDDLAKNAPKMWKKRQEIQSRRKIKDEDILRFITDPFMVMPKDTADFINNEYDFIKAFKLDEAFKTEFKTKVLFITGDEALCGKYTKMAKLLSESGFEVKICCPKNSDTGEIKSFAFESCDSEELLEAAKAVQIVVADANICDENNRGTEKLAQATAGKYTIADISNITDNDRADADFSRLDNLLKLGDFIICKDESQKEKYASMLIAVQKINPKAYSFNKTASGIFGISTLDKDDSFIAFCKSPSHLTKEEIVENDVMETDGGDEDDTHLNSLVGQRLAKIERQLSGVDELLKKNAKTITETERDVKEILEQSNLMNSRFLKLKNSLIKFRLFSRFFK